MGAGGGIDGYRLESEGLDLLGDVLEAHEVVSAVSHGRVLSVELDQLHLVGLESGVVLGDELFGQVDQILVHKIYDYNSDPYINTLNSCSTPPRPAAPGTYSSRSGSRPPISCGGAPWSGWPWWRWCSGRTGGSTVCTPAGTFRCPRST